MSATSNAVPAPPSERTKVTSAHVRAALALRYPKDSHALMFEVAPATGGGTRYADAVAVGLWASHGHQIEGFEIKVARSDWLTELKAPEKSEPVMRYCDRWWLVCAPGVAHADELPPNWGMLELQPSGTLRLRVKAPKLEPLALTRPFFASLVRRGVEPDNATLQVLLEREASRARESIRQELNRQRQHQLSHQQKAAEEAIQRLEALKVRTGIDFATYEYGESWFRAVETVERLQRNWHGLPALREGLARCLEVIDKSELLPPPEGQS